MYDICARICICIRAYVYYDVDGWSEVNEALAFGEREVAPSQRPVTL